MGFPMLQAAFIFGRFTKNFVHLVRASSTIYTYSESSINFPVPTSRLHAYLIADVHDPNFFGLRMVNS